MAGIEVKITRNFTDLGEVELLTPQLARETGLLARERIVRRTIAGRDADGVPFQPYSEGYAKAKAAALGGGSGGNVNLQVSGAMLNDLTVVETSVSDNGEKLEIVLGYAK